MTTSLPTTEKVVSSSSSSTWLSIPDDTEFSLSNLPFGIFSSSQDHHSTQHCATRLGDTVIDLGLLESALLFHDIPNLDSNVFQQPTLNAFLEHSKPVWKAVRTRLQHLFMKGKNADDRLSSNRALQEAAFYDIHSDLQMHVPWDIPDYTDFYASREHATNVGTMFRGPNNALQPNWLHLPVGYHGRSSTVLISGTPIRRPCGQLANNPKDLSQGSKYGPCQKLDIELEMGAIVGGPSNTDQQPLTIEQAKDRLFGLVLLNDWSARDIQTWEYVPLGPFTSKNFATTISPWIVTMDALVDALEPVPTSAGQQQTDPVPLEYLRDPDYSSYDVALTVTLQTSTQSKPHVISQSNLTHLYWTSAQQLVHHSVSGCVMRAGDLLGSGTISGSTSNSYGSLLELSWNGTQPIPVDETGSEHRSFLQDGDTIVLMGLCAIQHTKPGHGMIGFGECRGTILPAVPFSSPEPIPTTPSSSSTSSRYKDFKLYGYWRSSSTWRVRIQFAAKSISYECIPINIMNGEHKLQPYLDLNPMGQVPLLTCRDTLNGTTVQLAQSLAIVTFLDQAFPEKYSLLPHDPALRAKALEMAEVINSGTQPLQNVMYLQDLHDRSDGKIVVLEQAQKAVSNGLSVLEKLVQQHRRSQPQYKGPYCLGTFAPTIVEAFLIPQLYNARRFGVDVPTVCPTLVQIEQLSLQQEWFQVSRPEVQPDAVG